MIVIRFSKSTSLYEELTPFYNTNNAEEFFMRFGILPDNNVLYINSVEFGINITNTDSDVWTKDNEEFIFYHKLSTILRETLVELIEEFIKEDHPLMTVAIY